jgi:competence protein ComGF
MWVNISIAVESHLSSQKQDQFIGISHLVADSYNRNLAKFKVKIPGVKKVAIRLYDFGEFDFFGNPIKGIPVVRIDKTYDFEHFFSLSKEDQKQETLRLIHECVIYSAKRLNCEIENLNQVKSAIEAEDFRNQYFEGNLKPSKNRNYKAGAFVEMNETHADIFIAFTDKDENEIAKRHLIKVRPNRLFIKPLINKSKWKNNGVFEVSDQTDQIHFEASINNEDVKICFTPKNQTEDQLIDSILIASSQTDKELVLSLLNERINKLK